MLQQLTDEQITTVLTNLPGWTVSDGYLTATFRVPREDIPHLIAMCAAAEDKHGHHALTVILRERVAFSLHTADADNEERAAITAQDADLAGYLNGFALLHGGTITD